MRYHRMLTCAWLYEEERGECRSRCMAGLGGTKVDQMALDWFPLSIIEQQLIILKQARISDAEAQAAFACKDFWCWSLAGSWQLLCWLAHNWRQQLSLTQLILWTLSQLKKPCFYFFLEARAQKLRQVAKEYFELWSGLETMRGTLWLPACADYLE